MSTPEPIPWQRLDARMIWVDVVWSALSLLPTALAVLVFRVEPALSALWPVLAVAVLGVGGAVNDALRWLKTRYRITDELVERRTGLLVRQSRSIRRDRIRSIDTTARLRHRLAGLRLVTIGAGQHATAGEALVLDAVSRHTAERLRRHLLGGGPAPATDPDPERDQGLVIARLRWSWLFYNVFNIWAYVMAAGLLWGGYWFAGSFGLDPAGFVAGLVDWQRLGTGASIAVAVLAVGALGVLGLAADFVAGHWDFTLSRVSGERGTALRTRQGLFKTREVTRDDRRLRGVQIREPLLWRWLGVADTDVISTGLSVWSLTPATTILPRGPVRVARQVAAVVLDEEPGPLAAPLLRHPRAALHRRLGWAVLTAAGATAALAGAAAAAGPAVPAWAPLLGVGLLPVTLLAAVVSYRALGHGLAGDYLVVRSGLLGRSTAALQRRAVIGWWLRQSVWQRRLGLLTVTATTAAGYGYYRVGDVGAEAGVALADRAVPGLLAPFLQVDGEVERDDRPRSEPAREGGVAGRRGAARGADEAGCGGPGRAEAAVLAELPEESDA